MVRMGSSNFLSFAVNVTEDPFFEQVAPAICPVHAVCILGLCPPLKVSK